MAKEEQLTQDIRIQKIHSALRDCKTPKRKIAWCVSSWSKLLTEEEKDTLEIHTEIAQTKDCTFVQPVILERDTLTKEEVDKFIQLHPAFK